MANPSLQIGNDNWAIKEDNLLGYSTAGTRFVPQPITMTRASAGTRVNSSGLVETVELLGSELVDCGNFECAVPLDYWSTGTGWTISGGKGVATSVGSGQRLQQNFSFTNGKSYKIVVVLSSYTSGRLGIYMGGAYVDTIIVEEGTYIYYHTPTSGSEFFFRVMDSGTTLSIDNISVKEVTKNNLARVDYTDGTSSLLVEPQRTNLITYSSDFSDSSWLKVGSITTTDNYTTSPSGQNNATRLQWTNATNYIYQSLSHVGSDFTLSIYLKSNTDVSQNVRLFMDNGAQGQDVVVTTQWQRFEFTNTSTPTQSNRNTGLIKSSSQVGDLDISIWGAQFEEGSYPTSYIPTSGSTVTRNQETYEKTGISNLIGQTKGTMFIDLNFINISNIQVLFCLHDGATNKRLEIWASSAVVNGYIGGSVNIPIGATTITNGRHKIALAYDQSGNQAFYVDGVQIGTSGTAYTISALTTFSFNYFNNNIYFLSGSVNHTEIYKERLTNEELATLTTI